ncbi:MAG TPA: hypothetical protein VL866_24190 [Pyrinomonadaceae bacterium]|nr:hypothetical protein [Pyrinomonadaceae bacterium]
MGGEISFDDLKKIPGIDEKCEGGVYKMPPFFAEVEVHADRENATMAVHALTEIALETKNKSLAESCRDLIVDIIAEYGVANGAGKEQK